MKQKFKLFNFLLMLGLFFVGAFFSTHYLVSADTCFDADGNEIECSQPDPTCADSGQDGTYPNCGTCSDSQTGTYPNCTDPTCADSGQDGTYPNCGTCGDSQTGTYPDCVDNTCSNGATNPPNCDDNTCSNGATNPPSCDACPSGQAMHNGSCESYCNDFEACNPGAYEDCEYNSCKSCPDGETGTYPDCGICSDPTANGTYPDCTCTNGADNPPGCNDYCADDNANNYGESLPCTYDSTKCCPESATDANGLSPLNGDGNCPDTDATPPKEEDASVCRYCDSSSDDPACRVPFCGDPKALNPDDEDTCEAFNPGLNCVETSSFCLYRTYSYCDDTNATGQGTVTLSECEADKVSPNDQCVASSDACDYPGQTYCGDDRASNYDAGGAECQADNPGSECTADDNACAYYSCTIGFSLDITCPSGFNYQTPDNESYYYSYQYSPDAPYYESCVALTDEETDSLKNYFEQKYCGAGENVSCEGGFCGDIDWCPAIDGVQTDPTQCVDICPNDPGVQTSESQCTPAAVNGSCGDANGSSVHSSSEIVGSEACASGSSSVVYSSNGQFIWSCLGANGGTNMNNCNASLSCEGMTPPSFLCDATKTCMAIPADGDPNPCNAGITCANPNYCVDDRFGVSLSGTLDVTPIINKGDACIIDLSKDANTFTGFKSETHCRLYDQDGYITSFDPATYLTGNNSIQRSGINKDMIYTLKCFDGTETAASTYETSVGSCRLNLNSAETN